MLPNAVLWRPFCAFFQLTWRKLCFDITCFNTENYVHSKNIVSTERKYWTSHGRGDGPVMYD
jgi:hypothetical protein